MFVMMILMVVIIMITISLLMMTDNDQISEGPVRGKLSQCSHHPSRSQAPAAVQYQTQTWHSRFPWSTFSVDKTSLSIETQNFTKENMYKRKYFESMKVKVIRLFHKILQWKALLRRDNFEIEN